MEKKNKDHIVELETEYKNVAVLAHAVLHVHHTDAPTERAFVDVEVQKVFLFDNEDTAFEIPKVVLSKSLLEMLYLECEQLAKKELGLSE